jgi:hypothetical protein
MALVVPRELRSMVVPEDNVEKKRSKIDCDKNFRSKLLNLGKDVSSVDCIQYV